MSWTNVQGWGEVCFIKLLAKGARFKVLIAFIVFSFSFLFGFSFIVHVRIIFITHSSSFCSTSHSADRLSLFQFFFTIKFVDHKKMTENMFLSQKKPNDNKAINDYEVFIFFFTSWPLPSKPVIVLTFYEGALPDRLHPFKLIWE